MDIRISNIVLYCDRFADTLAFYRKALELEETHTTHWFVEFRIAGPSRLSLADRKHTKRKAAAGDGITLTFKVQDVEAARRELLEKGFSPDPIRRHPWGAKLFYLKDPEGHPLEFWEPEGIEGEGVAEMPAGFG